MEAKVFPAEDCAICLEKLTNVNIATSKCGHMFHLQCVMKVVNKKCPTCRQLIIEQEEKQAVLPVPAIPLQPIPLQPIPVNNPDWKQPNESDFDYTIRQFKLRKNWAILNEEMIVKLFQESKNDEMLHSIDQGSNAISV